MLKGKSFLKDFLLLFILMGILFIPFKWHLLSFHSDLVNFIFLPLVKISAEVLNIELILTDLSSDSKGLYILLGILVLFSIVLTLYLRSKASDDTRVKISVVVKTLASYYLALLLMKYGLDKILKSQFYLPEPNILYTPVGKLDKDILFWSTMGSSYAYNIFMGLAEIIPAVLLLFSRTRQLGGLLAAGVMINVLAINLSFDISVKLYSSFLLLLALFISFPTIKMLIGYRSSHDQKEFSADIKKASRLSYVFPVFVIIFLAEVFFPLIRLESWNDDVAERPFMHGAYECIDKDSEIKRLFIHRDGYLIFQDRMDNFADFKLNIERMSGTMNLQDYDGRQIVIPYRSNHASDMLSLKIQGKETAFRSLDWRELPLLKSDLHWTVD